MYMEQDRRRQSGNWADRGQDAIQSMVVSGIQGSQGSSRPVRASDEGISLSFDESKQLLAQLQALKDRNAELEAFNATVSHDLCTPITAINGYCQVLRELCRDQLDERSQEFLQGIYQGTMRMKEAIASLLEFSKVTGAAMHREPIDLSEMVQAVGSELKQAAPQSRVGIRVAKGLTTSGDPGLWRSVLDNLIGNAWKHGAATGKTLVEFGRSKRAGKTVYFVRDNGPGFDMALAEQLFLPFRRVAGTEVEGHGIGLATVDRIVRRHGGQVWAESAPGAGATFYFTME
jgi:light-regulated signal transduction histidine kinase (bacteriophytochrome)